MMIIQLNDVTKTIGGTLLFEQFNLALKEGQKLGLIGPNGCGKSTVLKLITGQESLDQGNISIRNGVKIGYLSQERVNGPQIIGKEFLMSAKNDVIVLGQQLSQLEQQLAVLEGEPLVNLLTRYGKCQEAFEEAGGYIIEQQIETICQGLGIATLIDQEVNQLSGGEQTLLALAKVLLEEADLYLLDEPTNHLDVAGIEWLENYIAKSKKTFMIVSHDRQFLNQSVTRIAELDFELTLYEGDYTFYQKEKEKRRALLAKDYAEQQKEIKKIKEAIRRFRQWGNESDNEKFYKRAKELERRLAKIVEIARPKKEQVALLREFNFSQRSGKEVFECIDVSKSFGGKRLFEGVNFKIYWQDKLAFVGGNGSGKSTLLKILLNLEQADFGQVKMGSQVELGYLSQGITYDLPQQTVLAEFRQNCDLHEEASRRLLANYLFFKDDVFRQVGKLSGGEKVRLELAKLMQQPNNLLVLDEPTNHLDIETRELLEEVLKNYQGTLVVVSHDRYFLKQLVTRYLAIEEDGIIEKKA